MDASNFSAGADLARTEVNRVAAIMRQSVPPAEKYKQELGLLNKAFSDAGRQSKEYANAVEHLKRKHGQLTPEVTKAKTAVSQLSSAMMSAVPGGGMLANAIKSPAAAALALAAAVGVMARSISQAATRIDEAAKAARSLGTTYNELISLQMLASEVAGLNAESLNRGLGQFVRRLAEARVNGGALSQTLRAIGLDAADLAAMNPAESWKLAADAIAAIPDKAEQVRVSVALFGKEGIKFVELMRMGGDALSQMNKEAERLGVTMSAEAAASVEAMNDAFGRAGMAIQGIWNTLTTGVAPAMTKIAGLVADVFVLMRSTAEKANQAVPLFSAIGWAVEKIVDGLRMAVAITNDLMSLLMSVPLVKFGGEINMEFAESNRLLDQMQANANGTTAAIRESEEATAELAIEAERAADAAAKQVEKFEQRVQMLKIENIELRGNIGLAQQMRLEAEGYNKEQVETIINMERQNRLIKEQAEETKELQRLEQQRQKERESDERAFSRELENARRDAMRFFNDEAKAQEERRKAISQGPGAGMEAGSAQAAKFMADAVNKQIGAAMVPDKPTPGEQEIARKTAELLVAQREANVDVKNQIELSQQMLAEMRENGFRRLR
jgi:hypothetical protein